MILNGSIDIMGDIALMKASPGDIYTELARRKGGMGQLIRDPNFTKQNEVLEARDFRFKAVNCSRRSGKSHTEVMDHIEVCNKFPKSRTLYMGLTLDSVTEIVWDVFKEFNEKYSLGLKFNETKKIVYYPNGSRTRLFGLDASSRQMAKILGQKLRKVSVDEAGSITINLEQFCFQKIRPALIDLAPNSWLTLLGTCETIPNTYFEKVSTGKCGLFPWKVFKWTAYENPYMKTQWENELEDIKKNTPLALETAAFRTHYLNVWTTDENLLIIPASKMRFIKALPQLKRGQEWHYMLGVDLGYNDATAYTLLAFSWHYQASVVCMVMKETEQDFTDVANTINQLKKDFNIVSIVVDGANKQGVEEIKKRHNLHEIEIAEKQGKATYLRLLRDDIIQEKLIFIEGESTDLLKTEWESLMWKDKMKIEEDSRCQNHASDSTLYMWRKTYTMKLNEAPPIPKQTEPEYEDYLEDREEQQARDEIKQEEEIYGQSEDNYDYKVG